MSTQITREQVIDYLGSLTPPELAILVADLEEIWGVSALPQVQQGPPCEPEEEDEEQEFKVVLEGYGDKKVPVIKLLRQLTPGLGIGQAKELVESAPVAIREGLLKEEADELKKKLEEAGGEVTIK